MIIDTDKIKEILNSEVAGYELASQLGISRVMIGKYRNGETDYMKMSLEIAKKFMEYEEVVMGDIKIRGLKKAVSHFNNWQGTARVYFDTEDNSVWTNIYTDPNWYDDYHSSTICEVYSKSTWSIEDRDAKITMKELQKCCEDVKQHE